MNTIGVAVKIQGGSPNRITFLDPLVCGNGNLLPSSKGMLVSGNAGVITSAI